MNEKSYLAVFQQAAGKLDRKLLEKKQLQSATGIYFGSPFLKLYKTAWANQSANPLLSESRIFFSIWVNDEAIKNRKMFYNIHALKLRHLKGYAITSRDFAADFRKRFKYVEHTWPNVSTAFGPLTLMEGFVPIDLNSFENEIIQLANRFLEIDDMIDDLLNERRKAII